MGKTERLGRCMASWVDGVLWTCLPWCPLRPTCGLNNHPDSLEGSLALLRCPHAWRDDVAITSQLVRCELDIPYWTLDIE